MAKRMGIPLGDSQDERFFIDRLVEKGVFSEPKLACIASRPGMGKTVLALDLVLPDAIKTQKKTLGFSSEKTAEQMVIQFIMKISGINISLMTSAFADPKKKLKLAKVLSFLSKLNIYIEDFEDVDDAELSYIENTVAKYDDVGFVLLDGLYCFFSDEKGEKVDKRLQSEAFIRMKRLSQRKNASIAITTYMGRTDIKKGYKEGKMEPLFLSSGVDLLLLLYRPRVPGTEFLGDTTNLLVLNKTGICAEESLCYDTKYRRFLKVAD